MSEPLDRSVRDTRLLWLRAEYKAREARTALVPDAAARLVDAGFGVVVETSAQRAFRIEDYVAAGCGTTRAGAWRDAPRGAVVLGLKELDPSLGPFRHRHVHFAHAFKGQRGWRELMAAFTEGGGTLFDLEYLVDEDGRRVAAFGYWAGFVGAALGLLALARARAGVSPVLPALEPWPNATALVEAVRAALATADAEATTRVLVIGARGRSGRGASALCEACGVTTVGWDIEETAAGGPFDELREHDVVVNCVFVNEPVPPFTTRDHLARPGRRLRVVVDVSCDPFGAANTLPLYETPTTLSSPVRPLFDASGDGPPLDLIAIDHLPSLLPIESSEDFSAQLLPSLLALRQPPEGVWARAAAVFETRRREALGSAASEPGGVGVFEDAGRDEEADEGGSRENGAARDER